MAELLEKSRIHSRYELEKQLATGKIQRIKRGWYAIPDANPHAVRAVRLRCEVGCLTACKLHGLWTPSHEKPHHIVAPKEKLPHAPSLHLHRGTRKFMYPVAPIADAVAQVLRFHDPETGLIVLESAVDQRHIKVTEAREMISLMPKRNQTSLNRFVPGAQSGSETRVRLFFQSRKVSVRIQVVIPWVGRVDMLVGKSLIIECDSRAHHSSPVDYDADRRRDLFAIARGFTVVRLSYAQIWDTWEETQVFLSLLLSTKQHHKPANLGNRMRTLELHEKFWREIGARRTDRKAA